MFVLGAENTNKVKIIKKFIAEAEKQRKAEAKKKNE